MDMTHSPGKSPDQEAQPLLLTGLPRCGSSWIGRQLAQTGGIRYRYESLNLHWVPKLDGRLGHFRYLRPTDDAPPPIRDAVERALAGEQSLKQYARALYRGYLPAAVRRNGTLVLKDPTACLLAGWLHRHWSCRVVVLVRHPCGFTSSIRRLNWPIRLQRLLNQRKLVTDHLEPFLPILRANRDDQLGSLGAFWAAVHHVLRRQSNDDWVFASFERLCLEPGPAFAELGRAIGIPLEAPGRVREHREDPGSTQKDGSQVAMAWRKALSAADVERVMRPVREFGLESFANQHSPPVS